MKTHAQFSLPFFIFRTIEHCRTYALACSNIIREIDTRSERKRFSPNFSTIGGEFIKIGRIKKIEILLKNVDISMLKNKYAYATTPEAQTNLL